MFEFTSVWTLAKSILAAGIAIVNFTIGRRERRQDPETQGNSFSSSILVVKWSDEHASIGPGTFKRKKAADPPQLSALLQKILRHDPRGLQARLRLDL